MARRTRWMRARLVWGRRREQSCRASLAVGFPFCTRPADREREKATQRVLPTVSHFFIAEAKICSSTKNFFRQLDSMLMPVCCY